MTTALEGVEGSASRSGRSLPTGKTQYPFYRRLGEPQGRSGQVEKISSPTWIRSPDLPARSQSLYRLRYPAQKTGVMLYNLVPYHLTNDPKRKWSSLRLMFIFEPKGNKIRNSCANRMNPCHSSPISVHQSCEKLLLNDTLFNFEGEKNWEHYFSASREVTFGTFYSTSTRDTSVARTLSRICSTSCHVLFTVPEGTVAITSRMVARNVAQSATRLAGTGFFT